MTAAPYLLGRRGPGAAAIVGGGGGTGDGVDDPVVTTTSSGDTTIKGKVKAGSFGKFVVPLATVQAGRQYTFRYTPQFAQLAQQGKLAMVGFGFKTNNDFHIVGLRGDGSTGLNKYKVYGTPPNGWNAQTGHTTSDGGAAASGTQAGPNYLRLITSADGTTYTLQSSANGSTWNTEFTSHAPSPFSNVSGATTFGVALWFNNADAGPFSIVIDQFADIVPAIGTLNPLDKGSTVTLLNGNLTAQKTPASGIGWVSVRSGTSHSSGKWYYEWTPQVFTSSFIGAGFANGAAPMSNYIGSDANGISVITDGEVFKNGAGASTLSSLSANDIIGLAIDIDNKLFWCRRGTGSWNGSGTANPATGAGGIALPSGMTGAAFAGLSVQSASGPDQGTANFGGTSFVNGPPSGFTAWG